MASNKSWLKRAGRSLANRLDQLRSSLDTLQERLREAIAQAVGQAVAAAVRDGVHAVLDGSPDPPNGNWYPPRSPARPSRCWQGDDSPIWDDNRDRWQELDSEFEEPEPTRPGPSPTPEPCRSRLAEALLIGCGSVAWWLRRLTGRCAVPAALGVGVVLALAAYFGGPLTATVLGLAGSALGLMNLAATAGTGAAALNLFGTPCR